MHGCSLSCIWLQALAHMVAGSSTSGCNRASSAFISAASDGAEGAAAPRSAAAVAGFLPHEVVGGRGAGSISPTGSTQWNLCQRHARYGLGARAAAQAADWPRLAGAWDSLRRALALKAASGAPASRRPSLLVCDMDMEWHVTRSRPFASRCDEIHARPCAAAAARRTVLSPMPLDRVLARPACPAHAPCSMHRTCTAHAPHMHRTCTVHAAYACACACACAVCTPKE